jgi:hypothetical protein
MDKFNDDYIANAIIQSEFLEEKYKDTIDKLINNKFTVTAPTSDLDPYYILSSDDNKIKLKASYIGKTLKIKEDETMIYINWAWSDSSLNKSSKVNLLKILKYFLDREPTENTPIFHQIYTAFIQSVIKVDKRFSSVILNTLLHLMKHIFYLTLNRSGIDEIYLIKEIIKIN